MIIVDNDPQSPSKANAQATSSQANSDTPVARPPLNTEVTPPPPPAYSATAPSGSGSDPDGFYAGPATPLMQNAQWRERSGAHAARKRFFKAFVIAVALFVVVNTFAQITVLLAGGYSRRRSPGENKDKNGRRPPSYSSAGCRDIDLSMEFRLPIDLEGLSIFTKGGPSTGLITFSQSHDHPDMVLVTIGAPSKSPYFGVSKVCLDTSNFALITIETLGLPHAMGYDIDVTFPSPSNGEDTFEITQLSTNLPLFTHQFESMENIHFSNLTIRSKNAPIVAESLSVTNGQLETTNSRIEGSFSVFDRIVLSTTNAPISASVKMTNEDESKPTSAKLHTTDSSLTADFVLERPHHSKLWDEPQSGGAFEVSSDTTNGALTLHTLSSPLSSSLSLTARTTNEAAEVSLDAAFEGHFALHTSNSYARVEQASVTHDPSGEDRCRRVECEQKDKRRAVGDVWWGCEEEPGKGKGKVDVSTSNGHVLLSL